MRSVLSLALLGCIAVGLIGAPAQAGVDSTPPQIVAARVGDADRDGRVDQLVVTFSEPISHAGDAGRPFAFGVRSYRVLGSQPASGAEVVLQLQEKLRPDGMARPWVKYRPARGSAANAFVPVRDLAGNQALKQKFAATAALADATPTPTPTASPTITPTPTQTPTQTTVVTPTETPTHTSTPTATPSPAPTDTPTATPTATPAPPGVVNVSSTDPDGAYRSGDVLSLQVTFSRAVTVTGTPLLYLATGDPVGGAAYAGGSGTVTLSFSYTILPTHNSPDLDYASTSALELNRGSIRGLDDLAANLTLPAPGTAGSLGANKDLKINTTAPSLSSIVTNPVSPNDANPITLTVTVGEATASVRVSRNAVCSPPDEASGEASETGVYTSSALSVTPGATTTFSAQAQDAAGNVSSCRSVQYVHNGAG